jgi:DNA-binding CsgD family transcriptional regulator
VSYDADEILGRMVADSESDWPSRLLKAIDDAPLVDEEMIDSAIVAPWRTDLSDAELRVLEASSRGLTYEMTADLLFVEASTVRRHLKAARHRLRAKNTTHACCEAIRQGLIR